MSPIIRGSTTKIPRLLLFLAALLAICLAIQLVPRRPAYFFKPEKPLKDYLPGSNDGWSAEDRPLGATEYESAKAKEVLRLDSFAFRTYRKGSLEFSIYCAFWQPGSQAASETAWHNPDACWVSAGWRSDGQGRTRVLQSGEGPTWPGQDRYFTYKGFHQFVVFWHIQGGGLSGFGMGNQSDWKVRAPYVYKRLKQSHLGLREFEQYLVRISANVPFEQLATEPFFGQALTAVGRFGLIADGS